MVDSVGTNDWFVFVDGGTRFLPNSTDPATLYDLFHRDDGRVTTIPPDDVSGLTLAWDLDHNGTYEPPGPTPTVSPLLPKRMRR